jgi:hypothetical protein
MAEEKRMQLRELAPDRWFKDRTVSTFWLRVYSCLFIPHSEFEKTILSALNNSGFNEIISFRFLIMNGMKIPKTDFTMTSEPDGMLRIETEYNQKELKNGTYVLILTPKNIDGIETAEHEVRKRLNTVAGILRAHTGHNFLRELQFEGEVFAGEDKFSSSSDGLKIPKESEGPHFNAANWIQTKEIHDAIWKIPVEVKQRVLLSLEYFNRAFDEADSFFFYWVSLEILCNGQSQAIKNKLKESLGLKSIKQAEETGFGVIAKWRHDFFHNGIRPIVIADVDRFIQLVYFDILRFILNLSPAYHTLHLINSKGYDLSSIGIPKKNKNQIKWS